jgi:hypothetical protein
MKKLDRERIPAKVVLEKERLEAAGEITQAVKSIHDAVISLQNLQDFETPLSAEPNDWQEALKKADKRKADALKAIASDIMLTQDGKEELAAEWKQWHKKAATACNTIIKHLTNYSACKFVFSSSTQNIVPTIPITEVAEAEAMRDVPPEARDHALLLAIVFDAVSGLREWEAKHDVRKIRLEQLLCLDETQLAEAWANGSVRYPSFQDFDKARELSNKSVQSFIEGTFV